MSQHTVGTREELARQRHELPWVRTYDDDES